MAKTAKDVIYRAMQRVNYIDARETPDPNDYQLALDEYQGFHEWMKKEFTRNMSWTYDAVPDEYWTHVAGWFAKQLVEIFPISQESGAKAVGAAEDAETRLREMLARRSQRTICGEFF